MLYFKPETAICQIILQSFICFFAQNQNFLSAPAADK